MPSRTSLLKKDQRHAQSFDFSEDVRTLVRVLADGMGISQVAVLELALRYLASRVAAHAADAVDPVRPTRSAGGKTGSPHSFRLSAVGRQQLHNLARHDPPLADSQVAVVERAIRSFSELAWREGLVIAASEVQ